MRGIAEAADREGWPAQKTIAALMEIEVAERTSRRIQRHREQSEAPAGKTFASFDFDAASGVRKQHILALAAISQTRIGRAGVSVAIHGLRRSGERARCAFCAWSLWWCVDLRLAWGGMPRFARAAAARQTGAARAR
jgi:hypothetical protein